MLLLNELLKEEKHWIKWDLIYLFPTWNGCNAYKIYFFSSNTVCISRPLIPHLTTVETWQTKHLEDVFCVSVSCSIFIFLHFCSHICFQARFSFKAQLTPSFQLHGSWLPSCPFKGNIKPKELHVVGLECMQELRLTRVHLHVCWLEGAWKSPWCWHCFVKTLWAYIWLNCVFWAILLFHLELVLK